MASNSSSSSSSFSILPSEIDLKPASTQIAPQIVEINTPRAFETAEERRLYRHRSLEILASNNENCLLPAEDIWPPRRHLYIMTDSRFGSIYNDRIHPKLLAILDPLPQFEELHVVIMAITGKSLQKICQWTLDPNDNTQFDKAGSRLRSLINDIHAGETPLPGASISIEHCESTSTLSFCFKHKTDIHGISNCHVLDEGNAKPHSIDSIEPPMRSRSVVFPSDADVERVIIRLKIDLFVLDKTRIAIYESIAANEASDLEALKLHEHKAKIKEVEEEIVKLEDRDNRRIGFVCATSGQQKPATGRCRQDWVVFKCDSTKRYSNKHRAYSPTISESDDMSHPIKEYGVSWLLDQDRAIAAGTQLLGFTEFDELLFGKTFIKLQGARSGIRIAKCSSTIATLSNGTHGFTTEYAFGPVFGKAALTRPGDSGTVLMSDENLIQAIGWGSDKHATCGDFTYATPILPLLEDIRIRMGWDVGSIKLL
ncbi:hypothetical protein DL95DRAFT_459300 [Leptodontidium sp. 2 PMI_412]|nr:hypothetical protein DL95DRAFT_459300 [Leptodontidium sp. 2 PMI_412]